MHPVKNINGVCTGARRGTMFVVTVFSVLTHLLLSAPYLVHSKAILGVDLGSLYMKIALVQRNSPLEIVTNLHSKRKTEQMVLFDQGSRFYGADASSLLARKPQLTPASMTLMLGRDAEHPTVQVLAERHYPIRPSWNDTRSGVCLTVDGNEFTPEELVAMVLTHARDITAAFGGSGSATVRDCVLTVPSFYTQHERRALLDAAELADLNVLGLIDENTAAALHYGMDRIDDESNYVLFYNMGASALQVSVVRFFSYDHKDGKYGKARKVGAFEVVGKGWDATLGGQAFDGRLVNHMADEFNKQWNEKRGDGETRDVRENARAMTKLRLQAMRVKHVLSANNDIPVFIDSLYDDTSFQLHVTRAEFEQICHDLILRSVAPIERAIQAAGLTLDDVKAVEMIGGGMRVPRVQEEIKKALGESIDLGMHINSDESMALGAAFHGANISTAFKVRQVGMADVNPFPIAVSLELLSADGNADSSKTAEADDAPWSKRATLFKSFGKIGVKKTIAFTQDRDVHCSLDYEENEVLPAGTERAIMRYNITGVDKFSKEVAEKGLGRPKVSLQFEMTSSGIAQLIRAEAAVEEVVIVQQEVEVDDDEQGNEGDENVVPKVEGEDGGDEDGTGADKDKSSDTGDTAKDGAPAESATSKTDETQDEGGASEAPQVTEEKTKDEGATDEEEKQKEDDQEEKPKKKKKTKMVEKEQKKVHKQTLDVKMYHSGKIRPYSREIMNESKAKLDDLAAKDKARMMLEESKNKYESYIYHIKNRLIDDEEKISAVTTEEQRSSLLKMAEEASEWLDFDGWDADLPTFEDRYAELSAPAEIIFFRVSEAEARPVAVEALRKKLAKVEDLMAKWEVTMPQVTSEERSDVLGKVVDARKWLEENEEKQAALNPWEEPAFTSAEVPHQTKSLESLVGKLSKRPKPKPVVKEKNETGEEETTEKGEDDTENLNGTETNTDSTIETENGKSDEGEEEGAQSETSETVDTARTEDDKESKRDDEL